MPVGQTWTQMLQSTQWPRPAALRSALRLRGPRGSPALGVVGDDQRVAVEHHRLEARVRAHVLAHLLAHEAGVAVGREAVEQDPEGLPGTEVPGDGADAEVADGREVADEGEPRPQRDHQPARVLQPLDDQLLERHRRLVEAHARQALALDLALDPQEDLGVDGLRAGVAAPQAAGDRGEQEQRVGGDDQQHRQVDHVLRPEHQPEDVELARGDVEQHRLPVVPGEPGQAVEEDLRRPHQRPAPVGEHAGDRPRVDLLADLVEADLLGPGGGRLDRDDLVGSVHGMDGGRPQRGGVTVDPGNRRRRGSRPRRRRPASTIVRLPCWTGPTRRRRGPGSSLRRASPCARASASARGRRRRCGPC